MSIYKNNHTSTLEELEDKMFLKLCEEALKKEKKELVDKKEKYKYTIFKPIVIS